MTEETSMGGSSEPAGSTSSKLSSATPTDQTPSAEPVETERLGGLDPRDHKALVGIDHWQDIQLKRTYAKWLLILVAAQLFVADAIFFVYAWVGEGWDLDAGVIQVWLAATLVELIGVALVI